MITLTQLYDLGKNAGFDIFDGITVKNGSPLNRDLIISSIMEKCGLNIPMYADPYIMRSAITLWSAKNQYTFDHVAKILVADYSPIENTDRYDDITVIRERDLKDDTNLTNKKQEETTTENHNKNIHSGYDDTLVEDTTSADNADDYQPKEQTDSKTTYNSAISDTADGKMNRNTDVTGSNNKKVDEDETTKTIQHLHGNIGTTTNTLLQTEEYDLLAKFNPYNFIAGLFENSLTLCIY